MRLASDCERFDMPAQTITPELKKDLQLLKLRGVIDPKRHYKKGDSRSKTLPKYFQVGTVIESASEFFSGNAKFERLRNRTSQLEWRNGRGVSREIRKGGIDTSKLRNHFYQPRMDISL